MKLSKFNVLITPEENKSRSILYNTFHDHRLLIENADTDIESFFKKIESKSPLTLEESEYAKALQELGIILDDADNEKEIFDEWYESKVQNPKNSLHVLLTISMACNLACPYCFEKDQLAKGRHMSLEKADAFIAWVKNKVSVDHLQHVSVIFFGGEPLINQKILFHVSEKLKQLSVTLSFEYSGSMITNGVLLKPHLAPRLRRAGIDWIKVTLDGEKYTHDTTRITPKGGGTFDQIIVNLEALNEDLAENEKPILIRIGGNFSNDTYHGFDDLLNRLETATFRPFIEQINLKPVQDVSLTEPDAQAGGSCHTKCFSEKNTTRIMHLRNKMHQKNLPSIDGLNLGPCDFYRGDSVSIDIEGDLYPCSAFLENKKFAIGNISDVVTNQKHQENTGLWSQVKPWTPDCYNCSFLPVCTGGCRATAYSNGYSWDATVCEKSYFTRIASSMAKEMLGLSSLSFEDNPKSQPFESSQAFSV